MFNKDKQKGWTTDGVDPAIMEVYQLICFANDFKQNFKDENWQLKKQATQVKKNAQKYELLYSPEKDDKDGEETKENTQQVAFCKIKGLPYPVIPKKKTKANTKNASKVNSKATKPVVKPFTRPVVAKPVV